MSYLGRFAALFVSLVGLPLHLLICACIKVADGGPALYRSRRLGLNGVAFDMLKYRTMDVRCKAVVRRDFKAIVYADDPRVTAVGRYLRWGIDEFAQVVNILRGEMSWIGPRPDEDWMPANYGPLTRQRLLLTPGITGFAQVLNSREHSTARGYALDIWYQRHRNLAVDLWIVAVTPLFVLGWKSLGRRKLARLAECEEFQALERDCIAEIERAVWSPRSRVNEKEAV